MITLGSRVTLNGIVCYVRRLLKKQDGRLVFCYPEEAEVVRLAPTNEYARIASNRRELYTPRWRAEVMEKRGLELLIIERAVSLIGLALDDIRYVEARLGMLRPPQAAPEESRP